MTLKVQIKELNIENDNQRRYIYKLQDQLDQLNRELVYRDQTIRSLHWALSVATGQIRKHQTENVKEFLKLVE